MEKESSSNENKELIDLIAKYELDLEEGKSTYWDSDQLASIAEYYTTESLLDEAQKVIDYGLKLHPGNTELLVKQGHLYLDNMEVGLARELFDTITETYDPDVKFLEAEILFCEDRDDEVDDVLNSIEEDDVEILIDILTFYMDMGFPEKAQNLIELRMEKFKENQDFRIYLCKFFQMTEQPEKAIEYYNYLIDSDSFNPEYWTGLSKCYFTMEEYDKSIEACNYALASDDKYGEAYMYRAHGYYRINNMDKAIEDYNHAIEHKSPSFEMGYVFLALIYNHKSDWKKSIFYNKKAIELMEVDMDNLSILVEAYSNLAIAVNSLGDHKKAHAYCEKAKKIKEDESVIYLTEASIYYTEKKLKKAEEACDKAMEYADDLNSWLFIADFCLDSLMMTKAQYAFEKVYEIQPTEEMLEKLRILAVINKDSKRFTEYNDKSDFPLDTDLINDIYKLSTFLMEYPSPKKSKKKNKDKDQE